MGPNTSIVRNVINASVPLRISDFSSWLGFYMNQEPGLKQYSFVRHPGRPVALGALMDQYMPARQRSFAGLSEVSMAAVSLPRSSTLQSPLECISGVTGSNLKKRI